MCKFLFYILFLWKSPEATLKVFGQLCWIKDIVNSKNFYKKDKQNTRWINWCFSKNPNKSYKNCLANFCKIYWKYQTSFFKNFRQKDWYFRKKKVSKYFYEFSIKVLNVVEKIFKNFVKYFGNVFAIFSRFFYKVFSDYFHEFTSKTPNSISPGFQKVISIFLHFKNGYNDSGFTECKRIDRNKL